MKTIVRMITLGAVFLSCASAYSDVLPMSAPMPQDNPMSAMKINLGRKLYFDPRLSRNNKISCNTCHDVLGSGTDNLPVSVGVDGKKGTRNSPTVWNAAYHSVQFWDGRAVSLEEQAKGPMINPVEMGMKDHDAVVAKISKVPAYQKEFAAVFGKDKPVTIDMIVQAIASYERSLITPIGPYDNFMKGKKDALSPRAQKGLQTFQTIGCVSCHMGPNFSGPTLPQGQGFFMKFPTYPGSEYEKKYHLADDLGRFNVTHKPEDKNLWRVPTLRNIALTAPYFHNGSVAQLDEAVRVMAKIQLNKTLTDDQVGDIVAFLESLTGMRPRQLKPELPKE